MKQAKKLETPKLYKLIPRFINFDMAKHEISLANCFNPFHTPEFISYSNNSVMKMYGRKTSESFYKSQAVKTKKKFEVLFLWQLIAVFWALPTF